MPNLTITITTRNRARFIGQTLNSILPQLTDDTELLIVDGASTDDTEQVIDRYRLGNPRLRYIRRDKPYGLDRDFSYSVESATGSYCWLMTDDDLLLPGAVSAVLDSIRRGPSLIVVNGEVRDNDLSKVLEPSRLQFRDDRTYLSTEWEQLFIETGAYLSFIGGVVIRRDIWLARNRERYFGSMFVHLGVLFQAPLPGSTIVLSKPYISIRYGNAQWLPQQLDIWLYRWPELVWSFNQLSENARNTLAPRGSGRKVIQLLAFRAKGAYCLRDYAKLACIRQMHSGARIAAAVVAGIPGVIANVLLFIWHLSPHRRGRAGRGLALFDLRRSRYFLPNLVRYRVRP